jgi:isopentenyl phosphate kinase
MGDSMAEEGPVVVKLGGSVLTRKREAARLRPKVLRRLAEELAAPGGPPVVLLHGAGSFGHPGAVRWNLAQAPAEPSDRIHRLRGASIVSGEVRRLHGAVLQALIDAGLSPLSVPPQPISMNRSGTLSRLDLEPFRRALARGGVPVSFGDVVPDEQWGFSILSADTIAVELVRSLPSRRLVFVSDVEGILEASARGNRRKPIARLSPAVLDSLRPAEGVADVTGGIRAKAEAMLAAAGAGADAGLISGLRHGTLSRAIRGESVYGTWCAPQIS